MDSNINMTRDEFMIMSDRVTSDNIPTGIDTGYRIDTSTGILKPIYWYAWYGPGTGYPSTSTSTIPVPVLLLVRSTRYPIELLFYSFNLSHDGLKKIRTCLSKEYPHGPRTKEIFVII